MSEEIRRLLIDTQWDTVPEKDPQYDPISHIWSLRVVR